MPKAAHGLVLLCAALAGGACGTSDDADAVRSVANGFYEAVRQDDGERACGFLSADTRKQLESQTEQACDDVVSRLEYEGGEIETVDVFVANAKVDLSGGESLFLSLEPEGWRIAAVGCKPETDRPSERPFECEVEA